ncbi:hypothetical protein EBT31_05225 [bacterium]|jgi:uncharacterized protein (DUF736 family)|nr:hypothetical protein [bacterium]
MQYDNTNKGVLFRNNEKGEGDKKPDYTGKLNVGGKDYRLAGWLRESKTGTKFLSVAVSEPKAKETSDEL